MEHMSIDWTEVYKKYAGKWVAFAEDELTVLASDEELSKVLALSAERGEENPIVHRVPNEIVAFVGHGFRL